MDPSRACNLQLRAYTVSAGYQQWIVVLSRKQTLQLKLEECCKPTFFAHDARALCPPHVRRQFFHCLFVKSKVDASTGIRCTTHTDIFPAQSIAATPTLNNANRTIRSNANNTTSRKLQITRQPYSPESPASTVTRHPTEPPRVD